MDFFNLKKNGMLKKITFSVNTHNLVQTICPITKNLSLLWCFKQLCSSTVLQSFVTTSR